MKDKILYAIIGMVGAMLIDLGLEADTPLRVGRVEAESREVRQAVKPSPRADSRKTVAVVQVDRRPLVREIASYGYVSANNTAEIAARVSARIDQLLVREGDWVEAGDTVAELDRELLAIARRQAQEKLDKALTKYASIAFFAGGRGGDARLDRLAGKMGVDSTNINDVEAFRLLVNRTRKDRVADQTGINEARLELSKAEIDLQYAILRAPFAGYIAGIEAEPSEFVNKGEVVANIVSLDRLQLEIDVLETEIRYIRPGARAMIGFAALPEREVVGHVASVNPTVDAEKRTCRVMVSLDNPGRKVRPGMFADVRIEAERLEDRLLVPREALLSRDSRKVVFVYEGGQAKWRYVETGQETDELVEVREGLAAGDSLITAGHFNLSHNARVVVVNEGM